MLVVGHTAPQVGGLVHYTRDLAGALARRPDIDVRLLSLSGVFPTSWYAGAGRDPVASGDLPHLRGPERFGLAGWQRVRAALQEADVVHVQAGLAAFAPVQLRIARLARRRGVAVVVTLHNLQTHRRWQRPLDLALRRMVAFADVLVVHADSLAAQCVQRFGGPADRVAVVPHGLYDTFTRNNGGRWDRAAARARLGLAPGDLALLGFGAMLPYKGLDVAVAALAHLPDRYRLLLAGQGGTEWPRLQALAETAGVMQRIVAQPTYIPDDEVALYLRAADVAIFPYREFSAQSGAAMAAVASGLPLVVSDLPGLRDLVGPERRVRPGDAAALAECILANEGSMKGLHAGTTWDEAASQTAKLYAALVGADSHPTRR